MAENRTLAAIKEFGSLINSALIVIAALGLVYTWGQEQTEINARLQANADAIAKLVAEEGRRWEAHADLHKERNGEVKEEKGAVNARLFSIEAAMQDLGRKTENGVYRIGILEDARKGDAAIIRDVQKTVTDLAGDMKVVLREIQQTKGGR